MSFRRRFDQRAQMRVELYHISEILHCIMLLRGRKVFPEIKMILKKKQNQNQNPRKSDLKSKSEIPTQQVI